MITLLERLYNETEEKLFMEILSKLLKRNPTAEDFKKLTRLRQEGVNNQYYLAYMEKKLGVVRFETKFEKPDQEEQFALTFVPFDDDQFLEPATNGDKVTF